MLETYKELLAQLHSKVRTVPLDEVRRRLDRHEPMVLVDVRESDEHEGGVLPGAVRLPRSSLEMRVEERIPDKNAPIVTYCAGGERSLLAAHCLSSLGYVNVESANPGFIAWRELGHPIEKPEGLTSAQCKRYSRQVRLPELGEIGQRRLLDSRVLLVGAGGLGSASAFYLAAAGVGTMGIADADRVDVSNLQRQILHTTARIGTSKVDSASKTISELNPDVNVETHAERVTAENVERLIRGYDLVVDGSDNFPTRFLVNDACVLLRKPVVHGSVFQFEGQVTTFVPGTGPCYRCWYAEPPPAEFAPSCAEAGVLGVVCGVIGLLQATEAIKLLLGRGETLVGRVLTYDALRTQFREYKLRRNPDCPVCGQAPTITSFVEHEAACKGPFDSSDTKG